MENRQVAEIFDAAADILDIWGANYRRIRAYRRAAENIAALVPPLKEIRRQENPARSSQSAFLPLGGDSGLRRPDARSLPIVGRLHSTLGTLSPAACEQDCHQRATYGRVVVHEIGGTSR
ncbi:MAG: hypothetical protein PVF54_06525 [Anaerolineae bacterium]|jgi:hypothetical protein